MAAISNLPVTPTSECPYLFCRVGEPRKCGRSLWNFVAILYKSWNMSTFGLAAAILDLSFPVTSVRSGENRSYSHTHCLMCFKCFWLNNMHLRCSTVTETRNYQKLSKIDSYFVISQGRDEIFYAVFTISCIQHLARNTLKHFFQILAEKKLFAKNLVGDSGSPPSDPPAAES